MRIATWNINGLRARLGFVQHWLEARKPDLVGLQELKLEDEKFPHDELAELGYQAKTHGQKSWNGVAVLARKELEVVDRGLPSQAAHGARLITVKQGDLVFATVYCPNGKHVEHDDFANKLEWFDALATYLEGLQLEGGPLASGQPSNRFVIGGDFNLCPGPLDTWSEELLQGGIFHTVEERQRFQRLLDLGLLDLYRHHQPDGSAFSWWDYRAGAFHQNHGLRIDFLLGTHRVAECVREVWIDRDYRKKKDGMIASDHAPVLADLTDLAAAEST